jgi:hypothetical protein
LRGWTWPSPKSRSRQGSSRLQRRGRVHDFVIEASAADIELDDDRVVSRLDHTRAVEVIEKLKVLSSSGHPCHHYVDDMFSPAPTLCAAARSVHIAAPSSAVALG